MAPDGQGKGPGAWLRGLLIASALAFLALGVWQLARLQHKVALIEQVNQRAFGSPLDLANIPLLDLPPEYQKVQFEVELLEIKPIFVKALTVYGSGYWMMMPVQTPLGVIVVNRGFVPDHAVIQGRELNSQFPLNTPWPGRQVGLIRASEPHGGMLRDNSPESGRWYSRDTQAMAQYWGLELATTAFIDLGEPRLLQEEHVHTEPASYPVDGLTVVRFRNNHLQYALTWFALAVLSLLGLTCQHRVSHH